MSRIIDSALKSESKVMKIRALLVGISPLLINRMTPATLEGLRTKVHAPKAKDLSPKQEAVTKIYRQNDSTGPMGIPTLNLLAAIKAAGRFHKFDGKKAVSTAEGTLLYSFLSIEEEFLPFADNNAKGEIAWEPDMRRGTCMDIAVCIVRPKFKDWSLDVTFQVDGKQAKDTLIRQLVDTAGSKAGIGDFRPNKGGPFGRFAVKKWEVTMEESDKQGTRPEESEETEASAPVSGNGANRLAEVVTS